MTNRFIVVPRDDPRVPEYERDSFGWAIVDNVTGECIGFDGGEPEDQLLTRDWSWVAQALNKLAEQLGWLEDSERLAYAVVEQQRERIVALESVLQEMIDAGDPVEYDRVQNRAIKLLDRAQVDAEEELESIQVSSPRPKE